MACLAVLCYAVLGCALQLLYYVITCCGHRLAVACCAVLCSAMLCCALQLLLYVIACCRHRLSVACYVVLCSALLLWALLGNPVGVVCSLVARCNLACDPAGVVFLARCALLRYAMLCCAMLRYAVLRSVLFVICASSVLGTSPGAPQISDCHQAAGDPIIGSKGKLSKTSRSP